MYTIIHVIGSEVTTLQLESTDDYWEIFHSKVSSSITLEDGYVSVTLLNSNAHILATYTQSAV